MDFSTFFHRKVMMSFFISVTCITAAMAVLGMLYQPDARFGYVSFFSPLLFGALTTLPVLVKYTKREQTVRQALVRNILHLLLLEAVVLLVLYLAGQLTGPSMILSLCVSILIIDVAVSGVLWMHDVKTAGLLNEAIKKLQQDNGDMSR